MNFILLFALFVSILNFIVLMVTSKKNLPKIIGGIYMGLSGVANVVELFVFLTSDKNKYKEVAVNLLRFVSMGYFDKLNGRLCASSYSIYCNHAVGLETRHNGGEMVVLEDDVEGRQGVLIDEILNFNVKTFTYLNFEVNDECFTSVIREKVGDIYNLWVDYRGELSEVEFYKYISILFNNFQNGRGDFNKHREELGIPRIFKDDKLKLIWKSRFPNLNSEEMMIKACQDKNRISFVMKNGEKSKLRFGGMNLTSFDFSAECDVNHKLFDEISISSSSFYYNGDFQIGIIKVCVEPENINISFEGTVRTKIKAILSPKDAICLFFTLSWWSQNKFKGIFDRETGVRRGSKVCHVNSVVDIVKKIISGKTPRFRAFKEDIYINEGGPNDWNEPYTELLNKYLNLIFHPDDVFNLMKMSLGYLDIPEISETVTFDLLSKKNCKSSFYKMKRSVYRMNEKIGKGEENKTNKILKKNWAYKRYCTDLNYILMINGLKGLSNVDKAIPVSKKCIETFKVRDQFKNFYNTQDLADKLYKIIDMKNESLKPSATEIKERKEKMKEGYRGSIVNISLNGKEYKVVGEKKLKTPKVPKRDELSEENVLKIIDDNFNFPCLIEKDRFLDRIRKENKITSIHNHKRTYLTALKETESCQKQISRNFVNFLHRKSLASLPGTIKKLEDLIKSEGDPKSKKKMKSEEKKIINGLKRSIIIPFTSYERTEISGRYFEKPKQKFVSKRTLNSTLNPRGRFSLEKVDVINKNLFEILNDPITDVVLNSNGEIEGNYDLPKWLPLAKKVFNFKAESEKNEKNIKTALLEIQKKEKDEEEKKDREKRELEIKEREKINREEEKERKKERLKETEKKMMELARKNEERKVSERETNIRNRLKVRESEDLQELKPKNVMIDMKMNDKVKDWLLNNNVKPFNKVLFFMDPNDLNPKNYLENYLKCNFINPEKNRVSTEIQFDQISCRFKNLTQEDKFKISKKLCILELDTGDKFDIIKSLKKDKGMVIREDNLKPFEMEIRKIKSIGYEIIGNFQI